MPENFKLKTRHQFSNLISQRNRWRQVHDKLPGRRLFKNLIGSYWAKHNYSIEERIALSSDNGETVDPQKDLQVALHCQASLWLLNRSQEDKKLTVADLIFVHQSLTDQTNSTKQVYRTSNMKPLIEGQDPPEWEVIPELVKNALEWFQADSFNEMHEVEKVALALIKLIDIQPFDKNNGTTLRLFSNIFLLQAGYPPAIFRSDQADSYALAIEEALCFRTEALVELLTESVGHSLGLCLGEKETKSPFIVLG